MTERIADAVTGVSPNHARDIDRGGGAVLAASLRNCGVRPRTELAEGCELSTAVSILVDHRLRAHHEPHIFAIGDCADPDSPTCRSARGPVGLVGRGWRQAEWLAWYLTLLASVAAAEAEAVPQLPAKQPGVVVLMARGLTMALAGDVSAEPWDEEALAVVVRPRARPLRQDELPGRRPRRPGGRGNAAHRRRTGPSVPTRR